MALDILRAELEELKRLGKVSDPKPAPPIDPFSGSPDPFRLDPTDFSTGIEVADALLESTPQDGSALMDFAKAEEDDSECECGGTYDEDDKCDSCSNGHDDCCAQECESCFERAIDRAELADDMARDEEMGL